MAAVRITDGPNKKLRAAVAALVDIRDNPPASPAQQAQALSVLSRAVLELIRREVK